jgi:hypothetical protein
MPAQDTARDIRWGHVLYRISRAEFTSRNPVRTDASDKLFGGVWAAKELL